MLLVAGVALGSGLLITGAWELSHERILQNERTRLLASLTSVLDRASASEPVALELALPEGGRIPQVTQLYAMLDGDRVIAWVYVAVAPQGYNGPIELLVGVRPDHAIAGARVLRHRETPGLGDAIETEKSDWISQFQGTSLSNPSDWALANDGGSFDAITGATVTPRAVVAAIEAVLQYHETHVEALQLAVNEAEGAVQ